MLKAVRRESVGMKQQTSDPPPSKNTRPYRLMGVGSILAQSNVVAEAFGRPLGFILMVLGLIVFAVVGANAVYWIVRLALHFSQAPQS
jgi:hypothetical protein